MIHHKTHPVEVEGCFGCRIATIGIASVPGGTRPGSWKVSADRRFNRDRDAYASARKAGETPDMVSEAGVRRARKRQESHERAQKIIDSVRDE